MVRLLLGEGEGLGHQRRAGRTTVVGSPNRRNDLVEHVDRLEQTLDDVGAGLRLGEAELAAAGYDLDLVVDVVANGLVEGEGAWHAVDEGEDVDAEGRLHRGVLEELVQHDVRVGVALELDHESGLAPRGVVLGVRDAVEITGLHEVVDLLLNGLNAGLVRQLGHHDARGALVLQDLSHRAQLHRAAAGAVRIEDALAAEDLRTRREVRSLDELHEVVGGGVGVHEVVEGGVDDLAKVVRGDVGGHAHRDALRAVDEQVRVARRQHLGLGVGVVVVRREVDRVLVDALEELEGKRGEARLGVAHGRRTLVWAGATEVAVAVDERVAHRELLDHTDQGVVDGRVAMGVVGTHDLADHLGALGVRAVGP